MPLTSAESADLARLDNERAELQAEVRYMERQVADAKVQVMRVREYIQHTLERISVTQGRIREYDVSIHELEKKQ